MLAKFLSTIAGALLVNKVSAENPTSCRALVMSGGGSYGSWEAGVMYGLTHSERPQDFEWDVVTGISAGSINAAGSAGWAAEESAEMAEYISDRWHEILNSDVWIMWDDPVKQGFKNGGILNDAPALDLMKSVISVKSEYAKRVTICTNDVNVGEWYCYNQTNSNYEDLYNISMSSSSIPGVFPPQHFEGHVFMDGGTQWDVNFYSAVQQCVGHLGYDMSNYTREVLENISVDIAMCGYDLPNGQNVTGNNAIQNYMASMNLKSYWTSVNNIEKQLRAYDGVNINYYIQNTNNCGVNSLNFNGNATWCLQEAGRTDAANAIALGQDAVRHAVRSFVASPQIRAEYPYIGTYVYSEAAAQAYAKKLDGSKK